MTDFTRFFLLGLGAGGIYALLGLGLVLIYRGSGVINFAQGAVGLLGLIFFYEYRSSAGDIGALVIGVVAAALLGALIQIAVMRPMRRSSALVRLIATLAILTIIQEGALIKYGPTPLFVTSFLPDSSWNVFSNVYVGVDRLLILGIAIVLTIVLDVVYRKTKFGLATTAVAENERATASFGWSPNLVAVGNWTAGCALAGFAAILLGPITSLSPNSVVLTVLPALAAALLGGFRSFPLTLAGGVAIGVMEAEATRYIHAPGWPTSAALIVIGAILVFRGRALPARGYRADRLPRIGSGEINRIVAVCAIALVAVSLFVFTDGWATSLITLAASGLIILSFVVLTGYCGQLSLAQYAIAGIGALIASRFADALQVPMPVAFVIGVVLTIPVGMLVALPAVRVRGINLAVLTLGLAIVIEAVVFSNVDYTGGALKGTIVKPEVFGWDVLSIFHPQRYAAICLAIFAIGLFVVANIRRGRSGRRMIAVRSNEQAAASLGISVVGAKLYAFGVGAALAAAGGIMYAFQTEHVDFTRYAAFQSVVLLLQAVLGGVGYVTGAIFGGLGAQGGPANEITSHWWGSSDWFLLIGAAITLLVIITHPEGVAGATAESAARLRRVFRRRAGREAAPESERGRWELSA